MVAEPHVALQQLRAGDRRSLARALSIAESTKAEHRRWLDELWAAASGATPRAMRVAITGAPGVGKSSLVELVGLAAVEDGRRVAVLPVDPSSRVSGGSLLADETRMLELSRHPRAFVRPSAAGSMLGGLCRHSLESIELLELAGYDWVIVETVGVGQSEADAALICDLVLLVCAPGAGDELQALKRGLNEACDAVLVNKADGELASAARRLSGDYAAALSVRTRAPDMEVPVFSTSASTGQGLDEVVAWLRQREADIQGDASLRVRRAAQRRRYFERVIATDLVDALRSAPLPAAQQELIERVERGSLRGPHAASLLISRLLGSARSLG